MDISFSTPKVNLTNSTGYGYATWHIIESLKKLGHNVPFQDYRAPIQLNFAQPFQYKLHRDQYQISYTPWESTVVPQNWFPMLEYCDEIWTTSDWCANVFEDNGMKNVKVYAHGIDSVWTPLRRQDDGVIKFLHVGEPAPRKAGQMAVNAFIELFGNNPNYHLTIKAYNNNTTRIFNNFSDKEIIGLPDAMYNNITVLPDEIEEEDLIKLYHDHDVLLYPSYGEGFGFIPLQALATGMPTICTEAWAHYDKFLGPLALRSTVIDSPFSNLPGKVYEPNYKHLLELMKDVALNFNAYSGFYFAQAPKIHKEYNWVQLTKNAFDPVIKKINNP
jgi:glycosyltransferase involved in cell wall biosynthesis